MFCEPNHKSDFVYIKITRNMSSRDCIFIEIEEITENDETSLFTTLESFLALYTYKYLYNAVKENVELHFVKRKLSDQKGKIKLNSKELSGDIKCWLSKEKNELRAITDLRLPIYQKNSNTFIAGMCAVCREIVKKSKRIELLGFKESCLLAPAESSVWTRFCELDIIEAINIFLLKSAKSEIINEVPREVTRFEKHMQQPVRTHNIYKLARNQESQKRAVEDKVVIDTKMLKEDLPIEHRFAEGVAFSIADLLLYISMRLIFEHCPGMECEFPLTQAWLKEIDAFEPKCAKLFGEMRHTFGTVNTAKSMRVLDCAACSLYKSDPKRYKPKNRIYTEQCKVDAALKKLLSDFKTTDFSSENPNNFEDRNINWNTVEPSHEESSALPESRLTRKRQQLESMANAVSAIAVDGDRIVDFCSGTGHLGILLALVLPSCTIILVENKAQSLERAKKRADNLKLTNIHFYQCNIDYFEGIFDLGTSLHACGTATDVVLQQCQRSRAKFVCCPCCYGSLTPMPHINYPLSQHFRATLDGQSFMYLAHAADQAHELGVTNCRPETSLQGQLCMDIVDTDRKYGAEEVGYTVLLTRLKPEQCTPKNHLLVGWLNLQGS